MRIDDVLPRAEFAERHATHVNAPPQRAWTAVRGMDAGRSPIVRALLALRALPTLLARGRSTDGGGRGMTIDRLLEGGFVLLAEDEPRELVLGLVGRFWTPGGGIVRVAPDAFASFDKPGYAVAAWNFTILPAADGSLVATETRIRCTDDDARRRFRRYWRLVRPFSGWTRREMLRIIRNDAESNVPGAEGRDRSGE